MPWRCFSQRDKRRVRWLFLKSKGKILRLSPLLLPAFQIKKTLTLKSFGQGLCYLRGMVCTKNRDAVWEQERKEESKGMRRRRGSLFLAFFCVFSFFRLQSLLIQTLLFFSDQKKLERIRFWHKKFSFAAQEEQDFSREEKTTERFWGHEVHTREEENPMNLWRMVWRALVFKPPSPSSLFQRFLWESCSLSLSILYLVSLHFFFVWFLHFFLLGIEMRLKITCITSNNRKKRLEASKH